MVIRGETPVQTSKHGRARLTVTASSLVLCSGGLDSTTIATDLVTEREHVELCFVDYGQPAAAAERRSATATAERLSVDLCVLSVEGLNVPRSAEIPARNLTLIALAMAARPTAPMIVIGIHSGTGYRDCSPAFMELMQAVLDFHSDGQCRLVTPFLKWSKPDIVALAEKLGVPIAMTHSCEAANEPCGKCQSCLDRDVSLAA
jgi:7-cyano-7-deazaguanine synthase